MERCQLPAWSCHQASKGKPGIECGTGMLSPIPGFWSPAMFLPADDPAALAKFETHTVVYPCLTATSCECGGNFTLHVDEASGRRSCTAPPDGAADVITPATAFECAAGHAGVLCASCEPKFFYKDKQCWRCDEANMAPTVWMGRIWS